MKHLNVPVLILLFGLIAGIVIAPYFDAALDTIFSILAGLFLGLIGVHLLVLKRRSFAWAFILLTTIFFVALGFLLHKRTWPEHIPGHYATLTHSQAVAVLLEIKEPLKPTSYQDKYVAQLITLDKAPSTGKLLLNVNKDSLSHPLKVGARYFVRKAIKPVPVPRNPHQFDYGTYLKHKRIHGQLSITTQELLQSQTSGKGIRVWAARFRESLQQKLKSHPFTSDQFAIINALILGQRQGIDREMSAQYAAAGMMHILAVSGLHVGIILLLLRLLTRPLGRYKLRFIRSGLIIILIWGFAILTGLSPSVLRAATMFSFLEASTLLGSKKESTNALIISAFILLLVDPLLVYQVGFQLSYLAVLSILWIQPWLSRLLNIRNRVLRVLWDTATVTTAAQLGVMPLSLFYFHQFPGLFLLSNIIILPLLGVLLGTGIIIVVLAGLEILPDIAVQGFGYIIDGLNSFIAWVAAKEDFVIAHIFISTSVMLALYLLIITVVAYLKKREYRRLIIALMGVFLFLVTIGVDRARPNNSQLIIFHKSRQTLVGIKGNQELLIQTNDSLWDYTTDSRIKAIRENTTVTHIKTAPLSNIILFKNKKILLVDSLGIYAFKGFNPDYIVLTQSPNINLDRLIASYPNITLIADGTNYKSDIDRWKATCRKQKIPFHSTYEKGAFSME